ncbi:MAG: hypothetical protein RQ731_07990 [Anaerosomatales bacterium]|nr:hypothetical protein [Anaerosomatales bacterium]
MRLTILLDDTEIFSADLDSDPPPGHVTLPLPLLRDVISTMRDTLPAQLSETENLMIDDVLLSIDKEVNR